MDIGFNNVLPKPLKDFEIKPNSIWESEFSIANSNKYLLNAVSGKGKSTFINILSGVRKDFDGDIKFDKSAINNFSLDEWSDLRRTKISTVYQDLQLFNELSVWDNLIIKNKLTNHLSEFELKDMLETLGIGNLRDQKCGNLSLGQQQRVAIIRSLAQPFELLLMDEPFSHLDKVNEKLALDIVKNQLEKNNAGIVVTTLGEKPDLFFDNELFL
jgi:ABC-type lipoprotein export system ATPase subunit